MNEGKYYKKLLKYLRNPHKLIAYILQKYATSFKWLPDKVYISLVYYGVFGNKLNLTQQDIMSFSEKLQWLKLYDRKPIYTMLVDKYAVRQYISNNIGEEYLVPLLGVWDCFDNINYDTLPNSYVMKCTHDSGSVTVCRDKGELDYNVVKARMEKSMSCNLFWFGREWPYKHVKPRIIVEKYLEEENDSSRGLTDYKVYCFNGYPRFLYISRGLENHDIAVMSFFDLDGNRMPFKRDDYNEFDEDIKMPTKFDLMKVIAKQCAESINSPFLRVDFYQIDNRVYISEFTFTPSSGVAPFNPIDWDQIIGRMMKLP